MLLAQELRGPQAWYARPQPILYRMRMMRYRMLITRYREHAARHPRIPAVVRLMTQETGVQGALGAQRTGTRRMPLQLQTNIPHLPRGNMGRGEISLSTTDDLKPKTEGGSWMGSGK